MHVALGWRRLAVGALAVGLLGVGCGDDGSDGTAADAGDDGPDGTASETTNDGTAVETSGKRSEGGDEFCTEERVGGTIDVLNGFAASGLDPTQLDGSGARGGDIASAFYGTVIRYDSTTGSYEPSIAQSWEANDDDSVWTLRLRDDVTFGNGDPFTTEHIAAHIERMKAAPVSASNMANLVKSIEIVDDFEMIVTLKSPYDFPYMMAAELGWIPNNNLYQERGDKFHGDPVGAGAGAYEVESISVAPGESLVLKAKDDWWGGPVCVQEIEFQYIEGGDAAVEAFVNGEADAMYVSDQLQAAELEEHDLLAHKTLQGATGYVVANQGFGSREETPYDDVRIREALQLAIDYQVLHNRLYDGAEPAPTSAVVPEDHPLYTGVEGPPTDPERAAKLVQEVKSEGVWDGSFRFVHSRDHLEAEQAVLLEGMWEAVGMDVTLEPAEDAAVRVIVDQDFEVSTLGFAIQEPEAWSAMASLASDAPSSRSGFADPEMDSALQGLQEAVGLDETREALAAAQEVWNETFPLLVTRHNTAGIGAQAHLHGITLGTETTAYYERAWVEE